jgi:hypothetical protein
MKKYWKKPLVIEAIRITDLEVDKIVEWGEGSIEKAPDWIEKGTLQIQTREGTMFSRPGGYIVKGVEGEFYPVSKTIFEKTYTDKNPEEPAY